VGGNKLYGKALRTYGGRKKDILLGGMSNFESFRIVKRGGMSDLLDRKRGTGWKGEKIRGGEKPHVERRTFTHNRRKSLGKGKKNSPELKTGVGI